MNGLVALEKDANEACTRLNSIGYAVFLATQPESTSNDENEIAGKEAREALKDLFGAAGDEGLSASMRISWELVGCLFEGHVNFRPPIRFYDSAGDDSEREHDEHVTYARRCVLPVAKNQTQFFAQARTSPEFVVSVLQELNRSRSCVGDAAKPRTEYQFAKFEPRMWSDLEAHWASMCQRLQWLCPYDYEALKKTIADDFNCVKRRVILDDSSTDGPVPEEFKLDDEWLTADYCANRFDGISASKLSIWAKEGCPQLDGRCVRRAQFPDLGKRKTKVWCYHRVDIETISDKVSKNDG